MNEVGSVVLSRASFSWPDGTTVLDGVTGSFGVGRTGLIGANGAGKTTLLRLIAGELTLTGGNIAVSGGVGYLPQRLALQTSATVADLVGVRRTLDAVRAIENGDTDPTNFDVVGDDWDVESRSLAVLHEVGLVSVELDRAVGALSGGETVLAALVGLRVADHPIVLLDEPTNNLDRDAKLRLNEVISTWHRTLIVVSHDVDLLNLMEETAELRQSGLTVYGGAYDAYQEYLDQEQAAAEQALQSAEHTLAVERRQRLEAETKLARRSRYAKSDYNSKRRPRIVMKNRASQAQVAAGKLRGEMADKTEAAQRLVDERAERVRRDPSIRIDLPDPGVPKGRRLAVFRDHGRDYVVQGPERVAIVGPNGVGKTRLLERLVQRSAAGEGRPEARLFTDRVGYLPQRLEFEDESCTILETVQQSALTVPPETLRSNLAKFLFRGESIGRAVASLSGGERFRIALARILLCYPPNQLLVLDEPTNNLDLSSVDVLVQALDAYHGGLLVVSHDDHFLDQIRIDTWMEFSAAGLAARR